MLKNKFLAHKFLIFTRLCFLVLIGVSFAQARWAKPEEAKAQIDYLNQDITVNATSSEEIIESRIKILNEAGREQFGVFRTSFNQNIQKIEIIEAKTTHETAEFKVPEKNIEIKPVASELNGFDQKMQVSVTYPNVLVGSTVHLKYKVTTLKQPLPNYYSDTFNFGLGATLTHYKTTIKSELPLHLLVNDPRQQLVVENKGDGKLQTIVIALKEKTVFYEELANEPGNSFINPNDATSFIVSTFDNAAEFAKAVAPNFEKVIAQPLPPLLLAIKEEAQKAPDLIDQINIVTSRLAEKVRYISDGTTIEGRFSPRSLEVTAQSAVGDCKDYSAATVAILRALGHKAHVAVVMRGAGYFAPEKMLPSFESLNHAMVKVEDAAGKPLWIDPTNFISIAGSIFPDIANRPVFVLDSLTPSYETIPNVDPTHAQTIVESQVTVDDSVQQIKGTLTLKGEQTVLIAGLTLFMSEQAVKESLIKWISGETTPQDISVKLPNLSARIVPQQLSLDFAFSQQNKLLRTNRGFGIALESHWGEAYAQASDDQEGTMFIGNPSSIKRVRTIKGKAIMDVAALNFKIETPWVQAARTGFVKGNDTIIEDIVVILKSFINAKEIKSPEFKSLKEVIKGYCQNVAVILPEAPPVGGE